MIDRMRFAGGFFSAIIGSAFDGFVDERSGKPVVGGIVFEMLERMGVVGKGEAAQRRYNVNGDLNFVEMHPERLVPRCDPERFKRAADAILLEAGVEILCFPEAVLGGLPDYYDRPSAYALNVENGQLQKFLSPLTIRTVSTIVGFTEMTDAGMLYNTAAIFHHGEVLGLYRKVYPAENHSVYGAGTKLPTFTIGSLTFGVIICNDTNYYEPARVSILGPQLAARTWEGQQTERGLAVVHSIRWSIWGNLNPIE